MTRLDLPEPIARYFQADKQRDAAAVALCFSKNAVVKDEGRTHSGRAAIQEWKAGTSAKYSYTSQPLSLEHKDGQLIVTSRLTGNFPGSPAELRYAFRLERQEIASLEITA